MKYKINDCLKKNNECDYRTCNMYCNIHIVELGIKPAEIMNIRNENIYILNSLDIKYVILEYKKNHCKVFIYNLKALKDIVRDPLVNQTLKNINYPETDDIDKIVEFLILKIKNSSDFPHEIGLFLGYPLKDVLSYMGYLKMECTKTLGWKMYGDTKDSEEIYNIRKEAKNQIMNMLLESNLLIAV